MVVMEKIDDNPFKDILNQLLATIQDVVFRQDFKFDSDYDEQFANIYEHYKDDSKIMDTLVKLLNTGNEILEKNEAQSVSLREAGNDFFKQEKYGEAMECYNRSILMAPCPHSLDQDSNHLDFALGLVNRF